MRLNTSCGLRKIAKSGGPGAAAAVSLRKEQAKNTSKGCATLAVPVYEVVYTPKEQPCCVGTWGSSKIATEEVRMAPKITKGKALRKNGKLTGDNGDPTSEYIRAADQVCTVRGDRKGPHKNGGTH